MWRGKTQWPGGEENMKNITDDEFKAYGFSGFDYDPDVPERIDMIFSTTKNITEWEVLN